jgi:hypothetical protein
MTTSSAGQSCDCGCCAGTDRETPQRIKNVAGQTAIGYRVGNWARFKQSLLAGLSTSGTPALAGLTSRADDDFTIALCDALAMSLDVLTFYQERIANEHYLRTATERRSIVEMARLIGYQPAPGVAASTYLAFTLHETPGDLSLTPAPIHIPVGTRVQSIPGQDEKPQSFETVDDIEAHVAWNAIRPKQTRRWQPEHPDTDLFLDGLDPRLKPGDAILIVDANWPAEKRWDVRVLAAVEEDRDNQRTHISWDDPLESVVPQNKLASETVQVFALRTRAALFGHNAPDPRLINPTGTKLAELTDISSVPPGWWKDYKLNHTIDLDHAYPGVTVGGWLALVSNEDGFGTPTLPGHTELYRAGEVREVSRTDFGMSGKITRVTPDGDANLSPFGLRQTLVLTESEELTPAARPLPQPVYGDRIALNGLVEGLRPGQALAASGLRQRIEIVSGDSNLAVATDTGDIALSEGESLLMLGAPAQIDGGVQVYLAPHEFALRLGDRTARLSLTVQTRNGVRGTLRAHGPDIRLGPAADTDVAVSEIAVIQTATDAAGSEPDHTVVRLAAGLENAYRRDSMRINANVAAATHGETVAEILGSGAAGQSDQQFPLKQSPVTYISADTPTGRSSTLRVRVNELRWTEVLTLCGHKKDERVYTVHLADDDSSTVRFGDGVTGAQPPSGQTNVRAAYRKGLGVAGNVRAATLTTLLNRPLGVDAATNPVAAIGGEDPEPVGRARDNAPLTVRTLDRAVSVDDYADYARAFAGIDKAHALWVPAGPARGVFITVAGIAGASVGLAANQTGGLLAKSLHNYGDPRIPIQVQNFRPSTFRTYLTVKVRDDYGRESVLAAVEAALRERFSFDQRDFGQDVTLDEVAATAQGVDGVQAAQVVHLYRDVSGAVPAREPRLSASLPVVSLSAAPTPAELLTLSHGPLELGVMP